MEPYPSPAPLGFSLRPLETSLGNTVSPSGLDRTGAQREGARRSLSQLQGGSPSSVALAHHLWVEAEQRLSGPAWAISQLEAWGGDQLCLSLIGLTLGEKGPSPVRTVLGQAS